MTAYKDVKFFDLDNLPDAIRDAVRPVALAHVSTVDAASIWEITVGHLRLARCGRGMGTASMAPGERRGGWRVGAYEAGTGLTPSHATRFRFSRPMAGLMPTRRGSTGIAPSPKGACCD